MPRGNRTGPFAMGPMTGRAAGYCAGYAVPGFMNPAPGWAGWPQGPYPVGLPPYGHTGFAGRSFPYPAYGMPWAPMYGRPVGRWFGRGSGWGSGYGRGGGYGRGRWR